MIKPPPTFIYYLGIFRGAVNGGPSPALKLTPLRNRHTGVL